MHSGKQNSGQVPVQLMRETARLMATGAFADFDLDNIAYGEPQNELVAKLRANIHAFGAAKSLQELQELNGLLIDPETGELRTWSQFKREAQAIHQNYNVTWLQSEYNHAVGQAQMANLWGDFERDKEAMPFLTYETVGDGRVRDDHRALDGITRPVDDAFWRTHYPRNDWGCRCTVTQTNDKNKVTHKRTAEAAARNTKLPPMFRRNAGKSQVLFDGQHPYFQEMDLEPTELEATTHYGMKGVNQIYDRTGKMPSAKNEPFNTWWEKQTKYGDAEAVVFKDGNGQALLFEKSIFQESSDAVNLKDSLGKPSEIWKNKETTFYMKYYQDRILLTEVDDKLKAIRFTSLNPLNGASTAELVRKGILIQR